MSNNNEKPDMLGPRRGSLASLLFSSSNNNENPTSHTMMGSRKSSLTSLFSLGGGSKNKEDHQETSNKYSPESYGFTKEWINHILEV